MHIGKKDVVKVEYNDPHKHASKLHHRITQSAIHMADRVSSQSKRKTTQFRGKCVWIIVFYFKTSF